MAKEYLDWLPILKREVLVEYKKAPTELHSSVHQMDHLDRVWERAEIIGERNGADLEMLIAAVYLHDIGRQYGLELHGPTSAKHAKAVLERIGFPKNKREAVLKAISSHDWQTEDEKRDILEAQVLYDCDKLDAFGKKGIERFEKKYGGKWTAQEILESIEERWNTLKFPESKEVGKKDYELIKDYFSRRV